MINVIINSSYDCTICDNQIGKAVRVHFDLVPGITRRTFKSGITGLQVLVRLSKGHWSTVGSFEDSHEGFDQAKHHLDLCQSYVDGSCSDERLIPQKLKDKIKKELEGQEEMKKKRKDMKKLFID